MELSFILLGFVGLGLVFTFIHVLVKLARERAAAARRKQNGTQPFSDDAITYSGQGHS